MPGPIAKPHRRPILDRTAVIILTLGALFAGYLIAAPLSMMFLTAFRGPRDFLPLEPEARWTFEHFQTIYADPTLYAQIIPDTLIFAIGAVAVTFAAALTLAWLVERTDLPGRNLWFAFILFPLLVPTPVLAIAWIFLLGPNAGWLNLALRGLFGLSGGGPINIFSMPGLIICQALASVPFMFLLLCSTLKSMNPALEEASGASGASPMKTFWRVTWPILRPGLLAPLILAFLLTLEQFELPLMIGLPARINIFSYRIWYELNPLDGGLPNYGGAAAVALPFLALGILFLMIYNRLIRQSENFITVTGKAYRQRQVPLGRWRVPALSFVILYLALAAVLPAVVLLWTSFFGYAKPSLASLDRFSLEAYRKLFANPMFLIGMRNTFVVATLPAFLVTTLGALLAWIVVRTEFRGRRLLDFLSFTSLAIPSVIAALAVMLLYLSLPIGVYGTVWILVIAYSYRFGVATRVARAGLMQVDPELEEASAASGAHWLTTERRIVLPLLMPALSSSFILLSIIGVREFSIALVLFSPDNVVLSVLLWRLFNEGQTSVSAALGTLIIALVLPLIMLARRNLTQRAMSG